MAFSRDLRDLMHINEQGVKPQPHPNRKLETGKSLSKGIFRISVEIFETKPGEDVMKNNV